MNLNPQQEEAAKAPNGPLLIVAGAGTGKTATLTSRLVNLIKNGVPAEKICAITFTNKAAREMAARVQTTTLDDDNDNKRHSHSHSHSHGLPFIGTFHGLGANILRREARSLGRKPNFVIFDDHDSFALVKKIVKKEFWKDGGNDDAGAKKENPSFFARKISEIKNTDSALRELRASKKEKDELALKIYLIYESRLEENNVFDFDDLIEKVVFLFKKDPEVLAKHQKRFEAVLVDEYQDLNPKQYELVKLLAETHKNLSVVGDDEQLIYGWRYANLKIFLGFERDWPGAQIKFLEENYRSTANIIEGASSVASNNNYRRPKNLWTKNPEGEKITIFEARDENDEAEWISLQIANSSELRIKNKELRADKNPFIHNSKFSIPTTAVLYRTNAQSRAIEQALIRNRIPYRIFGGLRFYERKEIKDIIAALRYATNNDEVSFDRLQKNISRGKLEKFLEKINPPTFPLGIPEGGRIKLVKNEASTPVKLIETFLKATDYLKSLEKDFINYEERRENIRELLGFAARFADLSAFLEEIALAQPFDTAPAFAAATADKRGRPTDDMANRKAQSANRNDMRYAISDMPFVSLMTIHLAKGLEFDRVFIAGCAEGLLPHAMSLDNEYSMEEERRLMYVAMTRAKRELCISFFNIPSRFISEIPEKLIELDNSDLKESSYAWSDEEEEYIKID